MRRYFCAQDSVYLFLFLMQKNVCYEKNKVHSGHDCTGISCQKLLILCNHARMDCQLYFMSCWSGRICYCGQDVATNFLSFRGTSSHSWRHNLCSKTIVKAFFDRRKILVPFFEYLIFSRSRTRSTAQAWLSPRLCTSVPFRKNFMLPPQGGDS